MRKFSSRSVVAGLLGAAGAFWVLAAQGAAIERFKMIDGGKALEDLITVEDPGTFITAWSAVQRFRRVDQRPLEEDVCAENNFAFFDYNVAPLPQAKVPDF